MVTKRLTYAQNLTSEWKLIDHICHLLAEKLSACNLWFLFKSFVLKFSIVQNIVQIGDNAKIKYTIKKYFSKKVEHINLLICIYRIPMLHGRQWEMELKI